MFIMALKSVFENPFFVPIILIPVVVAEQLIVAIIAVMVLQMVERLIRIAVCANLVMRLCVLVALRIVLYMRHRIINI